MATYRLSGVAWNDTGPVNGATCDAWLASRFTSTPAAGTTPPSGSPDGAPVVSGVSFGAPGAFEIQVSAFDAYYIRVQYAGAVSWQRQVPADQAANIDGGGA